jgi:hypothetical protein
MASPMTDGRLIGNQPANFSSGQEPIDFTGLGEPEVGSDDLMSEVELDIAEHQLGIRIAGRSSAVRDLDGLERVAGRMEVQIDSDKARSSILVIGPLTDKFVDPNRDGEDEADRPTTGRKRAIIPQMIAPNTTKPARENYYQQTKSKPSW